jgi:F-type H+-transporting ATPase subunit c
MNRAGQPGGKFEGIGKPGEHGSPSNFEHEPGEFVPMKAFKLACLIVGFLLLASSPALAQGPSTSVFSGGSVGAGLGAALTLVGAGYGLGRIGSAALESMARQPEVAPRVMTAMIIIAAMLEGATFFSLIVCILINGNASW